jgi:hypothetical protein
MHQGWEQRDLSELVRLVENWSDIEIK